MKAAVVGAGLTGLTAAYRLQQAGWEVEVFESSSEVGGRVRTVARDGYLVDVGASALATSYDSYFELATELGIRDEIRPATPCVGIFRDGRVHEMRMDRLIRSGLTTRLLSWPAKLRISRLAFDLARAVRAGQLDYLDMRKSAPLDTESAGAYARRTLGAEVDNYLCSPITRTMLIADTGKVSKVELFSGIANIFASQISALRGGQGRLPRTLAEKLDVRVSTPVTLVAEVGDGVEVTLGDGDVRKFDACVITAPLPVAAAMCPDRAALLAPLNERLGYTTGITVALGYGRRPDTEAMLVQLPTSEDPDVALMFVDHNKCPDRAPAGKGLIGTCWETDASRQWFDRPDADIVAHTARSVRKVFGDLGEPEFSHVTRWERALPMTSVGAYRLIGEFNAAIDPGDRIQFAGDYLSAAGQHTAIKFGGEAAARLIAAVR